MKTSLVCWLTLFLSNNLFSQDIINPYRIYTTGISVPAPKVEYNTLGVLIPPVVYETNDYNRRINVGYSGEYMISLRNLH